MRHYKKPSKQEIEASLALQFGVNSIKPKRGELDFSQNTAEEVKLDEINQEYDLLRRFFNAYGPGAMSVELEHRMDELYYELYGEQ